MQRNIWTLSSVPATKILNSEEFSLTKETEESPVPRQFSDGSKILLVSKMISFMRSLQLSDLTYICGTVGSGI